jgi:hypothetical protein
MGDTVIAPALSVETDSTALVKCRVVMSHVRFLPLLDMPTVTICVDE